MDTSGHSSLLIHNLSNSVALDFDWSSKCIFWSEVTSSGSSIKRQCLGNNTVTTLHSATLQNPDGLAVDWLSKKLYWCDKVSFYKPIQFQM